MLSMDTEIINLPKITDNRGNLSFLEAERHIPFKINSVCVLIPQKTDEKYLIEKTFSQDFFLLCLAGHVRVCFENKIILDNPATGIYIKNSREVILEDFSNNAVVLVLSVSNKIILRKIDDAE